MRILITGGTGYVGKVLYNKIRGYKGQGLTVSSMDRRYEPVIKGEDFIEADILDKARVRKALKGMDVVVHLAAVPYVSSVEKDIIEAAKVNIDGTRNILEAAFDVKRFVYLSTSGVYGLQEGRLDESCGTRPMTPYAEQKLMAEELIRSSGIPHVILRASNLYGLGVDYTPKPIVHIMIESALRHNTIRVSCGSMMRNFLNVNDCADAILSVCLGYGQEGLYNLGNEDLQLGQVAKMVRLTLEQKGIYARIEEGEDRPITPLTFIHDKAYRELGFIPKHTVQASIGPIMDHLLCRR